MALASPIPDYREAVDPLHYIRPVRTQVSLAVIAAAEAGLFHLAATGSSGGYGASRGLGQSVLFALFREIGRANHRLWMAWVLG